MKTLILNYYKDATESTNRYKAYAAFHKMYDSNISFKNFIDEYFSITFTDDSHAWTLVGNGLKCSNSFRITTESGTSYFYLTEYVGNEKIVNEYSWINHSNFSNDIKKYAIKFGKLKNGGGIIFFDDFFKILVLPVKRLDDDTLFYSVITRTINSSNYIDIKYLNLMDGVETNNLLITGSVESAYDIEDNKQIFEKGTYSETNSFVTFQHINVIGKTNNYQIFPVMYNNINFLDLYYYDGGTTILNTANEIIVDDRLFITLDSRFNFLIEEFVEEKEEGQV